MPRISESFERRISKLFETVTRSLDGYDENEDIYHDFYILHTFDDVVVAKDEGAGKLYEIPYRTDGEDIFLGELKEVVEEYVAKRFKNAGLDLAQKMKRGVEISGPIAWKSEEKRIAFAPVLVPGEEDSDGEIVTAEKIEDSAHEWLESYRNVDYQHRLNNVGIPVESYITPAEMSVKMDLGDGEEDVSLPAGTWILASKFGEETWEAIKDKQLTGFSVMGVRRETLDTASKSVDNVSIKRTLLADLGDDWVPTHVSIVDEPAVPKARFFALKSKARKTAQEAEEKKEQRSEKSWTQKLKDIVGGQKQEAKKEGRTFSESNYQKLVEAFEVLSDLLTEAETERSNKREGGEEMTNEELKKAIKEATKEATDPLKEEIEKLKTSKSTEEGQTEDETLEGTESTTEEPTDENEVTEDEESTDIEAFMVQVNEKIEAIEQAVGKRSAGSRGLTDEEVEKENENQSAKSTGRDLYGRKTKK